jgi:signal peptidase I
MIRGWYFSMLSALSILVLALVLLAIFVFILRKFLWVATVEGESMLPTLNPGDKLLVMKSLDVSKLYKSEIVIVEPPFNFSDKKVRTEQSKPLLIKRIVGLPGDAVRSTVFVPVVTSNSEKVIDQVVEEARSWEVPDGFCFVQGDNLVGSSDSRSWGPIPLNNVRGIVIYRFKKQGVSLELPTS